MRVRVQVGDAADAELRRAALAHLVAQPVENNLPLTLLDRPDRGGALALVTRGAQPVGVAVAPPDGLLVLSVMPAVAASALPGAIRGRRPTLRGVFGPSEPARAFAAAWERVSRRAATLAMRQRVFRLDAVDPPRSVPGRARVAIDGDLDVVLRWSTAFDEEAGVGDADPAALAARRVTDGLVWLWEASGTAMAMATRRGPVAGVTRIGHVYTPPEARRRGCASALVAALSAHALRAGARTCILLTDEANPTSNRIYQAIGYRPLGPALLYRFAADHGDAGRG